jgi:hypothetical protein
MIIPSRELEHAADAFAKLTMESVKRREGRIVENIKVQTIPSTIRLQRPFPVVAADSSDSAGYRPSKIAHIVSEWLAGGSL